MNDFDHDLNILVAAVENVQAIIGRVVEPGGLSDRKNVMRILGVLDDERVVRAARALRHRMGLSNDETGAAAGSPAE